MTGEEVGMINIGEVVLVILVYLVCYLSSKGKLRVFDIILLIMIPVLILIPMVLLISPIGNYLFGLLLGGFIGMCVMGQLYVEYTKS